MLPKELIKEVMESRNLSFHDVSTLTGISANKISQYLEGYIPSEKIMNNICNALKIDINNVTYDELNISINEIVKMTGKSATYIRNAIKKGRMPGSYVTTGSMDTFHIPRNAFYTYMGMQSNSHVLVALEIFTDALKKSLTTSEND